METNKVLATATENNLPEVVQDKFGNTKVLGKPVVYIGLTAKEAKDAVKKAMQLKKISDIK
jgi:hypothetical protein